ncbi:MAG: type II toxin-antitoxin system VapC family toxin [Chloroflexi bacterium]|nr:type II toxin-antitoxin system VapC family toxin [Chloroflexota bacterium]
MTQVCTDASFSLKLVLHEPERARVRAQWARWLHDGVTIIAPWLWTFETHAVLRRKVWRGELSDEHAREAWRVLRRQGIRIVHPRGLMDRAWTLAAEHARPTTYDTVYLATAELRGCELWTADQRLINALQGQLNWVKSV